jgi:hypothetical protein
MYKRCIKCGAIKNIDKFNHDKNRKDGLFPHCKDCCKEYKDIHWKKNRDKILSNQRKEYPYKRDEIRKKSKQYYKDNRPNILQRVKEYFKTKTGKEIKIKGREKYKNKYPEKIKAGRAISHAIQANKIPKARDLICHICGERQAEHYHHHKGYEERYWLDVIPVCIQCHNNIHNGS